MADLKNGIEKSVSEIQKSVETKHGPETEVTREHVRDYFNEKVETHAPEAKEKVLGSEEESPSYEDPELKPEIESLAAIVEKESLDAAIAEVYKTGNPALFRAFKIFIVEKLYQHLIDSKKISEPPL